MEVRPLENRLASQERTQFSGPLRMASLQKVFEWLVQLSSWGVEADKIIWHWGAKISVGKVDLTGLSKDKPLT